jgi:hypothetical protein
MTATDTGQAAINAVLCAALGRRHRVTFERGVLQSEMSPSSLGSGTTPAVA